MFRITSVKRYNNTCVDLDVNEAPALEKKALSRLEHSVAPESLDVCEGKVRKQFRQTQ